MTSSTEPDRDPLWDALTVEAGEWFARMHSDQVTTEDETAFAEWLDEDPRHQTAYTETAAIWEGIGGLRGEPGLRPLLSHLRGGDPELSHHGRGRRRFVGASALGLTALGVGGAWIGYQILGPQRAYATGFGEQRRVALEDGSTLTLNTETRVRVEFSKNERRLWLDQGQAHFIVAPDHARPFRVFVGNEEVRALGTRFEVRRQGSAMKVTLEEGSVAIIRGGLQEVHSAGPEAVLTPGEQALVTNAAPIQIASVDAGRVTAWRFGQMNLDSDPLSSAVAEINRYNARQIVLDSPELSSLPISGLFQTGSPDAFVDALRAALPVEVAREDERSIHLAYAERPQRNAPVSIP